MSIHLKGALDQLHKDLLSMCATVEEMIHKAVKGLTKFDNALVIELSKQDDEIDRLDVQIEEECLKILALHQPVAIDLRRIASVMKITGELERVADLGVHIAERASDLEPGIEITILEKLKDMARISLDMLHCSIDTYVSLDSKVAREVCAKDDEVDMLNREIISQLKNTMQLSPDVVENSMHLFSISRHLERIADHATNIAEDVVYLVEGEIIRHRIKT